MTDEDPRSASVCSRCGANGRERLLVSRVSKMEIAGYYSVFRCDACGNISYRDMPREQLNDD